MLKAFALLTSADDLLEGAWRERKWVNFVYFCLVATVGVMVLAFLVCLIGGGVYLEGLRFYWLIKSTINPAGGTGALPIINAQYITLFWFALGFSTVVGFFSLISAAPAMLVKGVYEPVTNLLFSFAGRISRTGWLLTTIAMAGLMAVLGVAIHLLGGVIGESPTPVAGAFLDLLWLILVVLVVPVIWVALAIGAKRLHDRNKSALWLLALYGLPVILYVTSLVKGFAGYSQFVLIAAVAVAAWSIVETAVLPGTAGPNDFGPEPVEGLG